MILGLAEGMSDKHLNDVVFCTENNILRVRENVKDFINKMKKTKFTEAFEFLSKVIAIIEDSIKDCNNSVDFHVFLNDLKRVGIVLKQLRDNKDEILLNVFANLQPIVKDVQKMVKGIKSDHYMELGYALGDVLKLSLKDVGDLTMDQRELKLTQSLDTIDNEDNNKYDISDM